jgi:hypothetical protein
MSFAALKRLDDALGQRGFPRLSPWWSSEADRFYSHGTARTWAARVGRGGAKSTMLAKLGLTEVLTGNFKIPPGERHYFAIVSVNRDEAAQRLGLLSSYLDALGVRHSRTADQIDLEDAPRGFRVFSCTVASVSGFRCIGAAGDEVAKWRSADEAANPAKEVATSLRAMTVTHASARTAFFSSPLTGFDWHSSLIDRGDDDGQIVSEAPTWIANPSITEEQTRQLEPDRRLWEREYAAIPQAAEQAAFEEADVLRAFGHELRKLGFEHKRALVIDASSGKKDSFTWAVVGWNETEEGARTFVVDKVGGFDAAEVRRLGADEIIRLISCEARLACVDFVFGDQRESLMISAAFRRHGLVFREFPWSATSKPRAVARVRRWLLEGKLALPEHTRLKFELLSFEERVTSSGDFTFGARGSGHDDYVSLLLTAALADEAHWLQGTPGRPREGAHSGSPSALVPSRELRPSVLYQAGGSGEVRFGVMPMPGGRISFGGF